MRSECFKGGLIRSQHKIDCRHKPKATKLRAEELALRTETHIELDLIIKKLDMEEEKKVRDDERKTHFFHSWSSLIPPK